MRCVKPGRATCACAAWFVLLAGAACSPARAASDYLANIPVPDVADQSLRRFKLQLELVVNGVATGQVVSAELDAGHFSVMRADLEAAGIALPPVPGDVVPLDTLEGVHVVYDEPGQRLHIDVPPAWLPHRAIRAAVLGRTPPVSSFGFLLNYDANIVVDHGETHASAWGEARLFGSFGRISLTGAVQRRRWTRYDLSWVRSDDEHMVTYEAGDFVTRNLAGNSAVRMAGVQISRDFSVRPDVVTYPLPAFAGQAALPSAIELFIDGYRAAAANVGPGNFTVGANPGLNGAGEATLAVTDTLGRRQTTTMPFYVANDLLRPGLFDYSVALGALRRGYGVRSFSYGPVAGMAAARYGLTSFITAEGSLEAGDGRVNGSLGGLVQLGLLGVANANLAVSNAHGNVGWRLTTGYQYRTRRLGVVASHMRESADFVDFAEMPFSRNARRVTTVAASLSTDRVGSFGVSYVDSRGDRTGRASLLGSSWSLPIARGVAIYGSGTYDVRRSGWSASFSLILPLGGRKGTAAVGISRDVDGGRTGRFDYGRAVPSEGGLGGSLSLARSSSAGMSGSGEVDWRTGSFDLRGGIFGGRGQVTPWAGASGSLVLMDGAVFAANHIADAFALVSTDGEEGVPVTYENQLVGKTDRGGHLLVPWVPSYYGAHYAINPLVLPAEAVAPKVEDRMAVARGAGAVLRFPISRPRMARVTLVDQAGSFVPVGALASINGGEPQVVGWDGLLFLADAQDRNLISVALPDGGHCTAQLAAPSNQGDASLTGPVTCR